MIRIWARFAPIPVLALFCACGNSDSGNPPATQAKATPPAAPSEIRTPVEVATLSGVAMIYLPGGELTMGYNRGNPDEKPEHKVQVNGFLMDKFEVTQEMFAKVQLPNPAHWQENPKNPVERVRWRDAKQYCNERSLLEGLKPCYNEKSKGWECDFEANGYRLPTEAEWEYACRAGSNAVYDFGTPEKLRQFAWFAENAGEKTHAVGQKKPNRWGLYDLYGNVSEWCEDVFGPEYYQQSPAANPRGPADPGVDTKRVMRGGSWKSSAEMCRATYREGQRTGDTDACFFTDYCGFRCVRRVTAEELSKLTASRK